MCFLRREAENGFLVRAIPAAEAIGMSSMMVPKTVFPPRCQRFTCSTVFLINFPVPISSGLITPLATRTPCWAASLKQGARATAEATKCSYLVSWKSAVLCTLPGLGYALTSKRTASWRHSATCSAASTCGSFVTACSFSIWNTSIPLLHYSKRLRFHQRIKLAHAHNSAKLRDRSCWNRSCTVSCVDSHLRLIDWSLLFKRFN